MILPNQVYQFIAASISVLKWIALTLTLVACHSTNDAEQQLVNNIAEQVILPAHQLFAVSTEKLQQRSYTFCQQPNNNNWQSLRSQWQVTMTDWQAVRFIQFGPATKNNLHWKIQFWPDKHNLIRKKINALLNSTNELTVARIKKTSTVIQGLSALEFLLFDTHESQLTRYSNNSRRCQLLLAIATQTQEVAAHLNNAWQPTGKNYLAILTKPSKKNIDYPTYNASISALVDTLVVSLEQAKKNQLAAPLGYRNKGDTLIKNKPQPYLSEAWRSRFSLKLLQAHLLAAQLFYQGGTKDKEQRYGFDHYLHQQSTTKVLAVTINNQFEAINQQFDTIKQPLFEAANNPQAQQQLHLLYTQITQLVKLFKNKLPTAMGVTLGFNANDGD